MLICPECHFENPDSNNFCQRCGTSLTHTICHKCGADIALNEPHCDVCGASNKILLWAIIASKNQESELATVNAAVNQTFNPNNSPLTLIQNQDLNNLFSQPTEKHLDSQKRYAIEEINSVPLLSINSDWNFIQVQVADKYPLNPSYLRNLKQEKPQLFGKLRQETHNLAVSAQYCPSFGVPTIALPYIILQKYSPIIPELHDAWQEAKQGIVILEDRSQWQLLSKMWSRQNLDLIQLLWSLDEIVKLWTPLSKVCCASSLLVESNLRLDEDQSLSLQQLYMDNPNHPPKLSDLAAKLQNWLNQYPQNHYEELNDLLQLAIAGTLESVDQLRNQMRELVKKQPLGVTQINNYQEILDSNSFSGNSDFEDNNYIKDNFLCETDNNELPPALIPMDLERIDHASCTDIGRQRDHNEDFFGIKTTTTIKDNSDCKTLEVRNLYIVCDGMGGHAAGEVASAMAVETLQNYFQSHWKDEFPDEATIKEGILYANQTLCQINSNNYRSGSGRMGTTVVLALIQDTKLAIAHVGDSRIYRITRKQGLEQLTLDHEVGQREINRGVEPEIAYSRPDAYQLTQALGPRDNKYVKPTIKFFDIQEDCLLLLCSDGLSDHELLERHGESYLEPLMSSNADLEAGLSELIDFANEHNGHDNITGVVVRVKLQPHL